MQVDQFLDKMTRSGFPAVFVLTGHGTGVVKKVNTQRLCTRIPASQPHPYHLTATP